MNTTGLAWFKSSYSNAEGEACLEIATTPTTIHIRDSKNPDNAPTLGVTPTTWAAFLRTVR
ncbi:DUF397 domain-containing protein [Streptomyces sp. NPDC054766]|uniref:DUF397 domain-containing protein n=1 Tax=Streptomyces rhizosphaerihabitans TaxID=1266770 RepID=UPI0021C06580|nr:DUF397 domain-containing protein [Streptomyces rhizosphaerihabitans]MCT9003333.1 DUF397 domain-containing protein [Streptomyces rhizosphaerihabitans]